MRERYEGIPMLETFFTLFGRYLQCLGDICYGVLPLQIAFRAASDAQRHTMIHPLTAQDFVLLHIIQGIEVLGCMCRGLGHRST